MKSKYLYLFELTLLLLVMSCEKLDRDIVTSLSENQVIRSDDFTKSRLSAIYSYLPDGFGPIGGAMLADATDDAEFTSENSSVQKFNNGSWDVYSNPDDVWSKYYRGIRLVNQFLRSTDSIDLDYLKLDSDSTQQVVYHSKMKETNNWRYEARFLRAFFYFELIKRYGGVPLITKIFSIDDDVTGIKRNTLEECIQYITDECDSAAHVLPYHYVDNDLGRITKVAALTLKSVVLLYAASDLFNDPSWAGGYAHPELISFLSGSRSVRWKAAAIAAKNAIDSATTHGYKLNGSYGNLFNTFNDPELILVRRNGASNSFEETNYPIGYDPGRSGTTPSQNLVDAYEMTDGTAFDWNDPNQASHPYADRDPRLAFTILTNNTQFKDRPVESWTGGLDGKGQPEATKTGYYLNKYVDVNLDVKNDRTSVHTWIIFRLSELYLNYAEALNECDPGNPDIRVYVNKVRGRAGMPGLPMGLSQDEMRNRIHHENRVEFAFEGHRFWDLRRWMDAPQYLGAPLRGVEITKTGVDAFTYNTIKVEERIFQSKMYLYPIPEKERLKIPALVQNPLW